MIEARKDSLTGDVIRYVLKNPATGEKVWMDDPEIQELAAALKYTREQGRRTVIFRTMRLDPEEAEQIINDSI